MIKASFRCIKKTKNPLKGQKHELKAGHGKEEDRSSQGGRSRYAQREEVSGNKGKLLKMETERD